MSLASLGALFMIWIAAIALPGPDLLQIIRVGTKDRLSGIYCAAGIMIGNTVWIIASLLGMAALIETQPIILHLIQLFGGAYIAWMGFGSIKAGWAARNKTHSADQELIDAADSANPAANPAQSASLSMAQALRLGIVTNLSNPKAIVFFASIFAQFIQPGMNIGWTIGIALFLIVVGCIWFIGFAIAVRAFARRIIASGSFIDIAAGIIFLLIGLYMVYEGTSAIMKLIA
ncbi:LysE family translocator [Corynebacterium sp. sy017]|uniref:LysE family translocator n=1 Tax=unclassified Corynebacterium TaxID=2624378 RepID=UPI0011860705|nr:MULTISPECIES: LysE family translocator [unclassified Corynebacterium]MBP3088333.1 LysE family translocator [Corynebacterium sp. sy017]TSD91653.1 LysE family translocator [Corynebacterium sp. SY003]